MSFRPDLLVPHLGWLVVGGLLALSSWRRPRLARTMFVLLFAGAAALTTWTAMTAPERAMVAADLTESPFYRAFLLGPFARRIVEWELSFACLFAFVAFGLTVRGAAARTAARAGVAVLLLLAPLGVASAFPTTLLMAGGLAALLRRGLDESLLGARRIAGPSR